MSLKLVVRSQGDRVETIELSAVGEWVLGRSAEADCRIDYERCLSRRHAKLYPTPDGLRVERLPGTANAIVFRGSAVDGFTMKAGEFFVIGSTTFQLDGGAVPVVEAGRGEGPAPNVSHTMSLAEMRDRGPAGDRMRLLDLMELPVVLRTRSRAEFYVYACGSLRMATGADWVQTVWLGEEEPIVLAQDARLDRGGTHRLSRRLMQAAVAEAPKPVTYCWEDGGSAKGSGGSGDIEATSQEGVGWAICCAMPVPGEDPVLFYVAGVGEGRGQGAQSIDGVTSRGLSLRNTSRLVGLVADMIGRAISMEKLEVWKSRLGQFFSEKVVSEILESDTEDTLAPRITEATVMFFDIRGFSARTEENFSLREEEDLGRILDFAKARRGVLNTVSQCVIDHQGVIISYAGDGLLACWNVPKAIRYHAELACLAAMAMAAQIQEIPGGWRCGIGLGCGQIVAGSLGSDQKEQYDILGAVVNQSSRIEGITKVVGVPVLVTEAVAEALDADRILSRRVARFRPAGMNEEVSLYTVVRTPEDGAARALLEERFAVHARGLEAFERGAWEEAFRILNPIATVDPAAKYLMSLALKGDPPRDWRGVIELTAK